MIEKKGLKLLGIELGKGGVTNTKPWQIWKYKLEEMGKSWYYSSFTEYNIKQGSIVDIQYTESENQNNPTVPYRNIQSMVLSQVVVPAATPLSNEVSSPDASKHTQTALPTQSTQYIEPKNIPSVVFAAREIISQMLSHNDRSKFAQLVNDKVAFNTFMLNQQSIASCGDQWNDEIVDMMYNEWVVGWYGK